MPNSPSNSRSHAGLYSASAQNRRSGLTLLELVIVLLVIAILAGLLVPLVAQHQDHAQGQATETSLLSIRDMVIQYWQDMGKELPSDSSGPPQTLYLFVNPDTYGDGDSGTSDTERTYDPHTQLGWRGPYANLATGEYRIDIASGFDSTYGSDGDPCFVDGWNQPIVIQNPPSGSTTLTDVRLISAGPNGILDTAASSTTVMEDDLHVTFQLQ